MLKALKIRPYRESDCAEIADLYHGAVHAINAPLYSAKELEAWAPTPPDYDAWKQRLRVKQPHIAVENGSIIGFVELEQDGHIDCLYVHKDYQSRGVASSLLRHVLQIAEERGIQNLHVEASSLARPLFEKFGFKLLHSNTVNLRGQSLTNYAMDYKPEALRKDVEA